MFSSVLAGGQQRGYGKRKAVVGDNVLGTDGGPKGARVTLSHDETHYRNIGGYVYPPPMMNSYGAFLQRHYAPIMASPSGGDESSGEDEPIHPWIGGSGARSLV